MNVLTSALFAFAPAVAAGSSDPHDWQWEHEAPVCVLRQQVTSAGESLKVSRTPANDETEIFVTFPIRSVREGLFRNAVITVHPGGKFAGDISSGTDETGQPQIYFVTPDPNFIEKFSDAGALEISHPKIEPIRLAVRSPSLAVAALRNCEDRKMAAWGIEYSAWRALRARPFPLKPTRLLFSSLDYPVDAAAQHIEADAIIRLDVGPDGRVTKCRSLNLGSYRGFEEASCRVLKRARFRPALNSASTSVAAPVVFDVRFRLAE